MIRGFLFFLILLPLTAICVESLSNSKTWMKLLHYEKNLLGNNISQADSSTFFFAVNGKTNPESELQETLKAFEKDPENLCRFPARFLFLKKELHLKQNLDHCQQYQDFKRRLNTQNISVVFSSYLLNSPASAFGHTLLKYGKESGNELLDHGANYAATLTTNNALIYAIKGLTGGFKGEFATMPYFYKIREYNDFETRDIWTYELNLTPFEIEMALAHLWEMKQTYFDYFYFTENCSYHILGPLDVANPSWQLQERSPWIVIPADTLRVIAETPGLLKKVRFLPSARLRFFERIKVLAPEEKKILKKITKDENLKVLPPTLPPESQAKILDAAIDYFDYVYAKEILSEEKQKTELKRSFLLARSQTGVVAEELSIRHPDSAAPHKGHGTRRVTLEGGHGSHIGDFAAFEYRFALNDLLDHSAGYNPESVMEMGTFKFRYNSEQSKLWFEKFTFLEAVSLSPYNEFFNSSSWRAFIGGQTIRDDHNQSYFAPLIELGGGSSFSYKKVLTYAFLSSSLPVAKKAGHIGARLGVGPELGSIYQVSENFKLKLTGIYLWNLGSDQKHSLKYGLEGRYAPKQNWAINLKLQSLPSEWESSLALMHYF